jgi:hypothetical protein
VAEVRSLPPPFDDTGEKITTAFQKQIEQLNAQGKEL